MEATRLVVKAAAVVAGVLLVTAPGALGQTAQEGDVATRDRVDIRPRFEGTLPLRTRAGAVRNLNVVLTNWAVRGGPRIERFSSEAAHVFQLLAGQLTTVIDGRKQERTEGEFWILPEGASMSIETADDTAILQVMTIKRAP